MAETKKPDKDPEAQARREFLKTIGKLGATVPAVSLLLAAGFTPAAAGPITGSGGGCGCGGGGSGSGGGCGCGGGGGGSGSGGGGI